VFFGGCPKARGRRRSLTDLNKVGDRTLGGSVHELGEVLGKLPGNVSVMSGETPGTDKVEIFEVASRASIISMHQQHPGQEILTDTGLARTFLKSRPAQNARPSPRKMTAATSRSCWSSLVAFTMPRNMSMLSALSLLGRLSETCADHTKTDSLSGPGAAASPRRGSWVRQGHLTIAIPSRRSILTISSADGSPFSALASPELDANLGRKRTPQPDACEHPR
jgi:hypothetical protein